MITLVNSIKIILFMSYLIGFKSCELTQKDSQLDIEITERIIRKIAVVYSNNYVFPEIGEQIEQVLQSNYSNGNYDNVENYNVLADLIEQDIRRITNDKHVRISYKKNTVKNLSHELNLSKKNDNYGFNEVKVLENGIAYINLTVFHPVQSGNLASEYAQEIMNSLKECNAIIFDLRNCIGGDPDMLGLLLTYLYPEDQRIHLNDFYFRPSNDTISTFTLEMVKGRRFDSEPVVVLTSNTTFSAAEEFAYDLKNLGRAIIIGEITGGGAHPIQSFNIEDIFEIRVPVGRAINPITKTNWEGIGVIPDIKIQSDKALEKAYELLTEN